MKLIAIALIFNGTDLVSGIIAALREKNLKSSALRDGLFKKIGFMLCYFLAMVIDHYGAEIGFEIGIAILPIIVGYTALTETVSIVENICRINPDLMPDKLLEMFHVKHGGDTNAKS